MYLFVRLHKLDTCKAGWLKKSSATFGICDSWYFISLSSINTDRWAREWFGSVQDCVGRVHFVAKCLPFHSWILPSILHYSESIIIITVIVHNHKLKFFLKQQTIVYNKLKIKQKSIIIKKSHYISLLRQKVNFPGLLHLPNIPHEKPKQQVVLALGFKLASGM